MIYHKYVLRSLTKIFFIILMVMTMLLWLMQALRFIDLITANGLEIYNFIKVILLLVTPIIYIIAPIVVCIAVIVFTVQIIHDNELSILRSCGLDNFQIAQPFIYFSLIIMLFEYLFSFYLLPASYREFKELQQTYRNQLLNLIFEEGVFNNQISGITIYIDKRIGESYYQNMFIYNQNNALKLVTIIAEKGYLVFKEDGPEFILYNGVHQEKNIRTNKLSTIKFASYNIKLSQNKPDTIKRTRDSNEYYIHELLQLRDLNQQEERLHFVNGNQRIVWPAYTLTLTIICLALILRGEVSRRFNYKKIWFTIFVVASFFILALLLNNLSNRNIYLISLMYANLIISLIIGYLLIKPTPNRYSLHLVKY